MIKKLKNFDKKIAQLFAHKTTQTDEYKFVIGRKVYYYFINFAPILDANREVKQISIGILDNSMVKELTMKLQSSEKLLASIFDTTAIGISVTNEEGYFLNVNQEYCRIYGYTREEMIGKHFSMIVPESREKYVYEIRKQLFSKGVPISQELQIVQKGGELINIQAKAALLVQENGKKLQITSITDITEATKYKYLLEKTQDNLSIGGWYIDLITGDNSFTKEVYDIYGIPYDYPLNLDTLLDCYREPDNTILSNTLEAAITQSKIHKLESQFTTWKGVKRWASLTCNPIEVDEKVVKLYGTIQDITKEKEQADKLIAFQKQYQLLSDNLHDVIFTTDENIKFTFMTPSVFRLYGYTAEEFMQLDVKDYLEQHSIDLAIKNHQKRIAWEKENPNAKESYVNILEVEPKRKNGTTFWTEVVTTRLYDENGNKIGFVGTIRDITLRKKQEEELKKLSLVASKTENTIIITKSNREIEWVNEAFVKTTGYSLDEVIGKTAQFLQGEETNPADILAISEGLKSKKFFTQEILNYNKKGEKYWAELNVTPILNENGEIEKFFAIQNNITARKISEQQLWEYADKQHKLTEDLTQQNNDLRQFSYILSHNIRSYVANILGIVNLMNIKAIDVTEQESYLGMLHQSANGLDMVIRDLNDILDVRKSFNRQMEKINLVEMLREVIDTLQNQIAECKAAITYDLKVEELSTVKPYLQSILYNLISNAIKYRSYNRVLSINISSEVVENNMLIKVKDNGLGIDTVAQKDNIFSLYKRFHTHTAGKGLGLYMVKTQTESIGGKITIESAINQGSTFSVMIPINL